MLLLEPVCGQIVGILLGLDLPPGILTYIGAVITLLGLFLLSQNEQELCDDSLSIIEV